jgi:hypothetical protein
MKEHEFVIRIPGVTRAEAESKLNLMLQIGEFAWSFNAGKLTRAVVVYWLMTEAGKNLLKSQKREFKLISKKGGIKI